MFRKRSFKRKDLLQNGDKLVASENVKEDTALNPNRTKETITMISTKQLQ